MQYVADWVLLQACTGTFNLVGVASIKKWSGVTANLFRSANLSRRNLFASGFVPDFQKISEFVPDGKRSMIL